MDIGFFYTKYVILLLKTYYYFAIFFISDNEVKSCDKSARAKCIQIE